jgi:hypothetical protein
MIKPIKHILAAALCTLGMSAAAETIALKDDAPGRYIVKEGDTLWDISGQYLDYPWQWPDIWQINPLIEDPHLIYPGDVITIVWRDGQQFLSINGQPVGSGSSSSVNVREVPAGTVKLSPQVREFSLEDAIPAIPRSIIAGFLKHNRIVTEQELSSAPYIMAGNEGRIIIGAGDLVYVRGNWDTGVSGWDIYRQGKVIIDPVSEEYLGYEAIALGSGNIGNAENGVGEFNVSKSYENIRLGDRLLQSQQELISTNFIPSAPEQDIDGSILQVHGGVNYIGQYDVVMINRGDREGLQEGHILKISRNGDTVKDPITGEQVKLPSFEVGLMMIFKTFDKVSYGLVMKASNTILVGDYVTSPTQ